MRFVILFALLCLTGRAKAVEPELQEFLTWPAMTALSVYQKVISPVKPGSCPMMPSDSAYARQAIRRHGFWRGSLMGIDRLHRCSHDLSSYPIRYTAEGPRAWDPVNE